jgi:hypothetical protein
MCDFKIEIELLLQQGNVGKFNFCEVKQVILFSDEEAINYFTHINFSSEYTEEANFCFVTDKPISVCDGYRIAINTCRLSIERFKNIYYRAAESGIWKFDTQSIPDVLLDDIFPTKKKFIPESDPTGGKYNMFVPLEYGLYGSNFMGNYYVQELFSKKTRLQQIVDKKIIRKIQSVMKNNFLNFRLDRLVDRIGNVVCKFNIDVLKGKPKSLGLHGIKYNFELSNDILEPRRYSLQVIQEHDGLMYENHVETDFDCSTVDVQSNQCKTSIYVTDNSTGLTLFGGVYDYSTYSNYYSQITPPTIVSQGTVKQRALHFDDRTEMVNLSGVQLLGSVSFLIEMEQACLRKLELDDKWFQTQGYIKSYKQNQHDKALQDIVNIINGNLLWDLKELWIIDPYLCADDIAGTALRCQKDSILIKSLCSYSTINGNKDTKEAMTADNYENFRKSGHDKLQSILTTETDVRLEYRSVRDGNGTPFHDRYLVMKYELNKVRVWSLGASINSIGKCHSIIQIVEAPEIIVSIFDELWEKTAKNECVIYKNW